MRVRYVRKSAMKFICVVVVTISLILSLLASVIAEADPSEQRMRDKYTSASANKKITLISELQTYADLSETYAGYPKYTGQEIKYYADEITFSDGETDDFLVAVGYPERNSFIWDGSVSWIEWEIEIEQTALYNIMFGYHAYDVTALDAVREFYIDGEVPYKELSNIIFRWNWRDSSEPVINQIGDESMPSQKLIEKWVDVVVYDHEGYYPLPLEIYLTAGKHTIRMRYVQQSVALSHIAFTAPATVPEYGEILNGYKQNGYPEANSKIYFEAEKSVFDKNSPNLPRVANYDPKTSPNVAGYRRLNTIGDNYWSKGGQEITWSFTVPEDGLYRIDMRALSSYGGGLPVFRQICIDGKVPFKEFLAYKFDHKKDWSIKTLSDKEGEPFLFYFTAGSEHYLSMKVILSEYSEVIMSLNKNAQILADYLLKVTMLTGTSPDVNYEYEIVRNIPETQETLTGIINNLEDNIAVLLKLSAGKKTPATNSLEQIVAVLRQALSKPERIPRTLNTLIENQTLLSMWYTNLHSMPLSIDYFEITDPGAPEYNVRSKWYEKLVATLQSFIVSFHKDYNSIGIQTGSDGSATPVIDVWVSASTEAAEILRELIDDSFTPQNECLINLNLLPAGQLNAGAVNTLMLSIISDSAPNVALGVSPNTPVELAIRDATAELSSLDGFEDISKQFVKEFFVPMKFNGKIYGLPERTDFRIMFYRKDIFASLGITVPDTWDELYTSTLHTLKQNQLEAYIPQDLNIFLFQRNGRYFTADGLKSAFDTAEGYAAFEEMVELYTNYGIPFTTAFFNRFRIGTIPLGIGGYADYISLLTGAPELAGRWGIAPIPGHVSDDGQINRSWSGSTMSSAMMLANKEYPEESWEFLKWWIGSETQVRYAREIEVKIGLGSRVNTANMIAFKQLEWKSDDLKIITDVLNNVVETPGVLGGPYVSRHINNAWNRIIIDKMNITVKDSFEMAIEEINRELAAKQEEYPRLVGEVDNIYE